MADETTNPGAEKRPIFVLPDALVGHIYIPPVNPLVTKRKRQVSLEGKANSRVDPTDYSGNGHWNWSSDFEPLGTKGYIGFIYVIQDIVNKKLYLGKKQYRGTGKINKGQESNWRWYISSSKELSESIKINGKNKFVFVAIEQYKTKGGLSYAESWSLMYAQTPVYSEKWYNVLINKITWAVREPPTERHKRRLYRRMDIVGAIHDNAKTTVEDNLDF